MQNAVQIRSVGQEHSVCDADDLAKSHKDSRGLLLVGLFKLSKSVGCLLFGAMCLHLIHTDLGTVAMKVVEWLGLDPTGHLADVLLDKADLINGHDLRVTGAFSFVGSVVYGTEGTGLILRKVWAEYFTVVLTSLGLPWEIYEMVRHFTVWKSGLFVLNVLVLAYLIWILRRKRAGEGSSQCGVP